MWRVCNISRQASPRCRYIRWQHSKSFSTIHQLKDHGGLIACAAAGVAVVAVFASLTRDPPSSERVEEEASKPNCIRSALGLGTDSVKCDVRYSITPKALLTKKNTIRKLKDTSSIQSLESKYRVDWENELGRGGYATVYLGQNRSTKEPVAIKKISKRAMDRVDFQREMNALLHLQRAGGHPNICSLHEHFDQDGHYYVVLDLIAGGEMFDYLVSNGAFSEHDASRLVREVASALAFLHGLETVHGDLKPENLLLSTDNSLDAVVKVVDFGCAQVTAPDSPYSEDFDDDDNDDDLDRPSSGPTVLELHKGDYWGTTPGYCPPEVLEKTGNSLSKNEPSMDMWALGVILYIMLTGVHPFDLNNTGDDDELVKTVLARKPPPLRGSPITAHLSDSAIDIMERLMKTDASKRLTAADMLEHPWVKGVTASRSKIEGSDKKLSMLQQAQVIEKMLDWSDSDMEGEARKASVVELAFREISREPGSKEASAPSSLSHFSDVLMQNMKNLYFPKGHVMYNEGDIGNSMYLISSGVIEVVTKDGTSITRGAGNFFGEGALLHPEKLRSATVRCNTPIHVLEISREFFEKHLAKSDTGLYLTLKEKDKIRKRNRAKRILQLQDNLAERHFSYGENLFKTGEKEDSLFLVDSGLVDICVDGKRILSATPGNICGEYSVLTGRPRNCTATCVTREGCKTREMEGQDFRKLAKTSNEVKASMRDLCLRRDFKKAVVLHLKSEFPYNNIREAFDSLVPKGSDGLDVETVGRLMRVLDPSYSDEEILEFLRTIDLRNTGQITYDEFEKVFISKQIKRDWL